MKIRSQFILLVAGVIVVPFLVTAAVLLQQYAALQRNIRSERPPAIASWAEREGPMSTQIRDLEQLARRLPPGADIVVFAPDDKVLFSTVGDFAVGQAVEQAAILRFVRANPRTSLFHVDSRHGGDAGQPVVLLRMPRESEPPPWFRRRTAETVAYTSLVLLVFSSLASFLIVRRLNLAVLGLEGATRRIAEGDLVFELPLQGTDEISSLTRSFDRMRKALKEEYARRARFLMGVSHDLKTPLSLIQGYVEAIGDGYAGDAATQNRYLSIISEKTRALENMIAELIEFVRMETGEWRLTFRPVRLRGFLTDIGRRYEQDALILKRQFRFEIALPEELTVSMDEALVGRALENLIGNAIRYTESGGHIAMSARSDRAEVVLSVSDAGIGISGEDLGRIFDPFFRGTNSRREQGFGLGLTTVKNIVEGHGWRIQVASQVGKGTTFTVRIPLENGAAGS